MMESALGREGLPEPLAELLPPDWSPDGAELLDLDREVEANREPPLAFPDGRFGLVWARMSFSRLADGWAEWLLEAHRLLVADGLLVAGLAGVETFEELTGATWKEDQIGMTVLADPEHPGREVVFHSEWWLRAHWGKAFEPGQLRRAPGAGGIVLRRLDAPRAAGELAGADPGDPRELAAAAANAELLRAQVTTLRERHRHELEAEREELGRELMRRSFREAEVDWMEHGPDSPGREIAARYESTRSWRMTRPLRAAGRFLRRLR